MIYDCVMYILNDFFFFYFAMGVGAHCTRTLQHYLELNYDQ
jgi:hypothetical protein